MAPEARPCPIPGCMGNLDGVGTCDRCGCARPSGAPSDPSAGGETAVIGRPPPNGARPPRPRSGSDLVAMDAVPERDPATTVMTEAMLVRAAFTPELKKGNVVAGRYEVVGPLAIGGMGCIYLVRHRNVDDIYRVLKGLLDPSDTEAMEVAISERRFLATIKHPNIVGIVDFVTEGGASYIVMDYVDGVSLSALLEQRPRSGNGRPDPLPAEDALAYIIDVLPALAELHANGLVYCDFKPSNVMVTSHGPTLIDLGAVQRVGDARPSYATRGFIAPEVAAGGEPSVASDLYSVARTVAALCVPLGDGVGSLEFDLPDPASVPLFARCDSLYRVLQRATASEPDERFQSAAAMADQLTGVRRELLAQRDEKPEPGPSSCFTGDLGGRPGPAEWHRLPRLRVSGDDPAAGYLATLSSADPDELIRALEAAPDQTVEVQLRTATLLIEAGRNDEALEIVRSIEDTDPWEWRSSWCRGLAALAGRDPPAAVTAFERVYSAVPGELAPKLALGLAAEAARNEDRAARWYDTVSRTDPAYTTASFGLARCRLRVGDRAGALDAYDRVPESSSWYLDAQVARVRLLLRGASDLTPDVGDLSVASQTIDSLTLDGETRARLESETFQAVLRSLATGVVVTDPDHELCGYPLTETGVRLGLEGSYRRLARWAPTTDDRVRLVDQANHVRPRTWT